MPLTLIVHSSLNSRATLRTIHEIQASRYPVRLLTWGRWKSYDQCAFKQSRPSLNTITGEINYLAEMRSPTSAFNNFLMK